MVWDEQGKQHPLLAHDELKNTLLEHSQTHFAQAKGSPFTTEPLSQLLQYDGLTPDGDLLTNLHNFDEP